MKGISNAKLILLQPSAHKQTGNGGGSVTSISILGSQHRVWLIAFLSFFTFASLLTLLTTTSRDPRFPSSSHSSADAAAAGGGGNPYSASAALPGPVFDTLVHYAAAAAKAAGGMAEADIRAIAAVIRRRAPCNLLIFGLGHETPLWRALNHGGRTVFLDENEWYIKHLEGRHQGLEAYDVAYTTKVKEMPELIAAARHHRRGDCRPVQNLLFSDCRLALNDLPNALYEVNWDVILVDGPKGYSASSPGRMAAIFTAAVMARSGKGAGPADVLVHDYEREVERTCSEEFLCRENMVGSTAGLAHFAIRAGGAAARGDEFCEHRTDATMAAAASK